MIGSIAAGIAGAFGVGPSAEEAVQGVRFVTGNAPNAGWLVPARLLSPFAHVDPEPGGPQPISPGPHPGGPGDFGPFEPGAVDPGFGDITNQHFGVVVFEGTFKLEVANHLGGIVQSQRQMLVPVVRSTDATPDSQEFKFLALPHVPEYVKSVFEPFLRDLIEFAADRFGLKAPEGYQSDLQVMVTPSGGGSVPRADDHEPGGWDRRLSWIYFIPSVEPYHGGDLVLYDTRNPSQLLRRLTRRIRISPAPNTLIIFPSALVYEITQVIAAQRATVTRPTVQGWLRWTE